ncbi:Na+/H+ antiporter NhaA [Mariprofundus ferrooxydans]|uniref:Na(+)/H(+) antiporter NhaA n=1 Tax=Mariprofundus ferrooxydans PV-1 TaxID=314345 RepID=Q0EWA3_9PROT|nr:Na+/H+ antiporter NhaA [Mariprofundus ferrooxydans]EAU53568.1 Na+/H+ antiporter NhaA [Mariprofundus ferrooxydans PV-1]KON47960.1 sodium:proton antiporter [Mariprofundus ferrooxydans]
MLSAVNAFFRLEAASGILLIFAALFAVVLANSPLSHYYDLLLDTPVEVRVGAIEIAKPLLLWINDGLMAVFFFIVGLELKREVREGELASMQAIALPAFGALGGMIVPAVIYILMNRHDPIVLQGWAIPTATDIAFALAILTLLGKRVPLALKTFLVSLAIFDDIGAIIIIAIFYTSNISTISLVIGAACLAVLALLNRINVYRLTPYLLVGLIMWVAVLKSGVHATLAGVLLALFIPLAPDPRSDRSPLKDLERDLHAVVAFVILPLFAFFNSGLDLTEVGVEQLLHPATIGVALGLFVGKQLGVFTFAWLAVKAGLARLPGSVNWRHIYGASLLCGIGFTMSLFIGSLAFEGSRDNFLFDERLGIIAASTLSAVCGYLWLNRVLGKANTG